MELSRRGLLASILGAVVAGSVISISSEALADPVVGRYAKVIQLQQKLYATNRAFKEAVYATRPNIYPYSPAIAAQDDQIQTDANDLFGYMNANFPHERDNKAHNQIIDLLDGKIKIDTLSENDLRSILDSVVPVAVAKNVFSVERCAVKTTKMPNFDTFVANYKESVLGARREELA